MIVIIFFLELFNVKYIIKSKDNFSRPVCMLSTRDTPQNERLKVKGWQKIFHEKGKERKLG